MSFRDEYATLRDFGVPKRQARIQALVNAVRAQEADREYTYDADEERRAVVHTRDDVVALIGHVSELGRDLRSLRRWLMAAVVLLFVIAWNLNG